MNYSARGMGKRGANRIHACQPFMEEIRGERKHVFSASVLYSTYCQIIIIFNTYPVKITL